MFEDFLDHVQEFDRNILETEQELSEISNSKVIVACSGGADSIALALIFKAFNIDFALCYIEHGLNPATVQCELITKDLAQKLDVPFFYQHLNLVQDLNANIEATARQHRYEALEKIRVTHNYDLIATAHHEDDLAETFFINLMRGSGSGVSSLKKKRNHIVRPLLHWRKKDLMSFVEALNFEYFHDESNDDKRFVRNRVRHELIPLLNEIAGRDVTPLIARSSKIFQSDNEYLNKLASQVWPKGEASTKDLRGLDPVIQVHALRNWIIGYPPSEDEMDRILQVVNHEIVSTQISGDRTIWRRGAVLYQDVTSTRTQGQEQ
ncbi:MAG: tRNA lysidine(34) synthetase TilS [Acidimicrobiia bacterium]